MFDRYVVVDWSANSTPKLGRDSIWIAVHDRSGNLSTTNVPTRHAAEEFLVDVLDADRSASTLLGVDFSLGYPTGTAAALGLGGVPWSAMWAALSERVCDDGCNVNNRFAVAAGLNRQMTGSAAPFWGCPPSAACEHLTTTKPAATVSIGEYRAVEEVLRSHGRRPFSSWQLLGAGAVGSQSLLGIVVLDRLRRRFGSRLVVWPFTTTLRPPAVGGGSIVVAEVWPSMFDSDASAGSVRDAAQVSATARWMAAKDSVDELEALFAPEIPAVTATTVVAEEGWVLGVAP